MARPRSVHVWSLAGDRCCGALSLGEGRYAAHCRGRSCCTTLPVARLAVVGTTTEWYSVLRLGVARRVYDEDPGLGVAAELGAGALVHERGQPVVRRRADDDRRGPGLVRVLGKLLPRDAVVPGVQQDVALRRDAAGREPVEAVLDPLLSQALVSGELSSVSAGRPRRRLPC